MWDVGPLTSVIPVAGGGGGDAAQTTAFLAQVAAIPVTLDPTHLAAYKALINGLVSNGLFSKFDALWIFATQNDRTLAYMNLISTSFSLSDVTGPPTLTTDRGLTFGAPLEEHTGITPSAGGLNYSLNDAHLMLWQNTVSTLTTNMGGSDGPHTVELGGNATTTVMAINGNNTGSISSTPTGTGFYLGCQTGSTNRDGYWADKNVGALTSLGTANSGTTVLSSQELRIGSVPNVAYGDGQYSAASVGASFNSTDAATFHTLIQAFMTAVGNV